MANDVETQAGAVYLMLSSLEKQGGIGVVAIGDSPAQADEIYLRVVWLLDEPSSTNPHGG